MNNEDTRSFEIVVNPRLYTRAYYTLGVHEKPRWACFLSYSFYPRVMNRNTMKEDDTSRFDIIVPSDGFIMELLLSEGTDFDEVFKKGKEECDKILKNIPMHLTMNPLFNGRKSDNIDKERI